ncbi:unnamed protein product [Miscanthus lutarioriparius]|uniref:Uncharacterized protein n=1 Tax=Miscanthus lutarioriparius TaxID=422564 RepID=A0A811SB48_9POAL|nr:unnamed protein product [Miscanthus lutarioriparius]
MANQQQERPNHPANLQHIGGHDNVEAGHRDNLLDAARVLMLLGAAAAVSASASASTECSNSPDADAAWIFLAFVTWLLGVCLLSLVPLEGWLPQADRLAGAAIAGAGAVLRRFFVPWN